MVDKLKQAPASPSPFEPGSLAVIVVAPDSQGVAGATVTIKRGADAARTAPTDKSGTAFFDKLTPGNYAVTVNAAGMGRRPIGGAPFAVGPANDTAVVAPGPDGSDFTFVMTLPVGFLSVQVKDKNTGKPIAKVPVEAVGKVVPTGGNGIAPFGPVPIGVFHKILAGVKGKPTAKPFISKANPPEGPVKFEPAENLKSLVVGEVALIPMLMEEFKLEIAKIDDHFAPTAETLDIRFRIKGLAKRKVMLTIEAENYSGKKVVERELSDGERADGEANLIPFSGKIEVGPLKDSFINPLMGPFKVRLEHVDADNFQVLKDEKPFKVLYHSFDLKLGPWTPDEAPPPESEDKKFVAFKLNELGYWGGPVGKDTDDYLKKAIIAYKQSHKKFWKSVRSLQNDAIDADLKNALKAGDGKRVFMTGDAVTSAGATSKVYVDAFPYERTSATGTEFATDKVPLEKKRINRPLLPLEATIFLKGKDNSRKLVPDAVGECRISFHVADPNEDISGQFTSKAKEPSKTKDYIEAALKLVSGRTGENGDNCPSTLGGIRKGPGLDFDQCFLLGDSYVPYVSASDSGQKVVFTKACIDKAKFPKRHGKAGIYFRPSYVAGDDYKLTAEIDFTGLPNKVALERDHGTTDPAKRIKVKTGVFRVIRRARIAAVIDWPARTGSMELDKIKTEFEKAHHELDTAGFASKTITSLITQAEYLAAATATPRNGTAAVPATPAPTLSGSRYYGLALPAQGTRSASDYKKFLVQTTYDNYAKKNYHAMGDLISGKIRATDPVGFILVNTFMHEPVTVRAKPPTNNAVVDASFICWGGSIGLADSTIIADMKDPDQVYYVFAHEMGHNLFLLHNPDNTPDSPPHVADHDTKDHNCLMAYSTGSATPTFPHQKQHDFTPHFCGKCNLKLRGWDAVNASMPSSS